MTDRFDIQQAAAPGLDETATPRVRQADDLAPSPAPDDTPRPGGGGAEGRVLRSHAQAPSPNYRRSLFRR